MRARARSRSTIAFAALVFGCSKVDPFPPIANAGPDRELLVGQMIELDGSASSDPSGSRLAFAWSVKEEPAPGSHALVSASASVAKLRALVAGAYLVELTVSNEEGLSSTDHVAIRSRLQASTGFSLERFDPGEAYVLGTLAEGSDLAAIAHWSDPHVAAVGLPSGARPISIRPSDGMLLYLAEQKIRGFVCDACDGRPSPEGYSRQPELNDPIIAELPCPDISQVLVAPTSEIWHACRSEDTTRLIDAQGDERLRVDAELLAAGNAGRFFARDSSGYLVVALDPEAVVQVEGIEPFATVVAVRSASDEDGFLLALQPQGFESDLELWVVGFDGRARKRASYSPAPFCVRLGAVVLAIDSKGRIYVPGQRCYDSDLDLIVRRGASGESEILYDEWEGPRVKLHGPAMFSGP
jgi:hypothetical protein